MEHKKGDIKKILTKAEAKDLCKTNGGIVVIPSDKEEIGEGAFSQSKELISVTIPGSVKIISRDAFKNCCNLAEECNIAVFSF